MLSVFVAGCSCGSSHGRDASAEDTASDTTSGDTRDTSVDDTTVDTEETPFDTAPLGTLCERRGGTCEPGRWANCPAGTRPTGDIHADCLPEGRLRGYFCCVPAESAACSDSEDMLDCFAGDCELCWEPAARGGRCAEGRTCCGYTCLD